MRILLVEDEFIIALEAEAHLKAAGHDVVGMAATPAEALTIAGRACPDLALVDIRLAQGTSGLDAARDLGRLGVSCVFVTSYCNETGNLAGIGLGCLGKPFSRRSLLDTVAWAERRIRGQTGEPAPPGLIPLAR